MPHSMQQTSQAQIVSGPGSMGWIFVDGLDFQRAIVSCALFLNVRGLSDVAQRIIEARGGFTGTRPMILGRELYESPQ